MENKSILSNILTSKKGLIIIAVAFVILVVIGVIIGTTSGSYKILKIDNLSSYKDRIPENYEREIQGSLYDIVSENTNNKKDIPSSGAVIRDDSFSSSYDDYDKTTSSDFIIDIAALKQSYYVQFDVGNDVSSTAVVISCLPNTAKVIYKDFKCHDEFTYDEKTDDPYDYISDELPYFLELEDGNFAIVAPGSKNSELSIRINKCTGVDKDEVLSQAKSWIDSLYINPDSFTYKVECKSN